jgi:hypothetical protein
VRRGLAAPAPTLPGRTSGDRMAGCEERPLFVRLRYGVRSPPDLPKVLLSGILQRMIEAQIAASNIGLPRRTSYKFQDVE